MEPLFFKAENNVSGAQGALLGGGFNGAAFFQSGKCSASICRSIPSAASMEPLFFKAENTEV